MKAIVESAAFLALSGDDVINPDVAVAQLEQLAAILKTLTPSEREEFIAYVQNLASSERRSGNAKRADFLSSLPSDLGLTS